MDTHEAYRAACAADDAFSAELRRLYGRRAGDARYTPLGVATPELKRLSEASQRAIDTWLAMSRADLAKSGLYVFTERAQ